MSTQSPPVPTPLSLQGDRRWFGGEQWRSGWRPYAAAIGFSAAATLVAAALGNLAPAVPAPPAILFAVPIVLAAYLGGFGPGLLATAIAATVSGAYLLRQPATGGRLVGTDIEWAALVVSGALISALTEVLHRSRRDAATRDLQQAVTLESIGDAVIMSDIRGRARFLNREAERLTGWTTSDAAGRALPDIFRVIDSDTRVPIEDPARTTLRTRRVDEGARHALLVNRSGRELPIDCRAALAARADGRPLGAVLIFRDATDRQLAESVRRQQLALQDRLARIALTAPGVICALRLDVRGRASIPYASPRISEIFGYPAETIMANATVVRARIHPDDRARVDAAVAESAAALAPWQCEFRVWHPEKGEIWIEGHATPERDADGGVLWYGFLSDITARKRSEVSLLRSQKLEALGTLAGGIAHDFNNLLVAIGGNVKLAASDLPPEHPAQLSLTEIDKASARAADLVRRILTFSRPQESQREPVDLRPIVEEALRLLRASLPAMIEIRSDVSGPIPKVAADPTQMHQVIVNLVSNAAHAIGPRVGLIHVLLDAVDVDADLAVSSPGLSPGPYARLSVVDDGCGMDAATLERIFDPFFTTKPTGQGTGLGLSVVHGIIRSHGGAITVSSQPTQGSTFRVYLPATANK